MDCLIVHWPNGLAEKTYDIPSNQTINLVEDSLPVQVEQLQTLTDPISISTNQVLIKESLKTFSVRNVHGQKVLEWNNANEGNFLNLNDLSSGIYVISWIRENNSIIEIRKTSIVR
jgi:hypothetical protein